MIIVECKFYGNQFFTIILLNPFFPYQISFIDFTISKNLFTETNLYYRFSLCIFMTNFFGIKLIAYSTIFYFFLGGTDLFFSFVDYIGEFFFQV